MEMLRDAWRGRKRCCRGGRGYPCDAHTSPSCVDAVPGSGRELGGERSAAAQPVGMRALGRRPRVPGRAPAPACGPSASALMGKTVIQRALPRAGEREIHSAEESA